MTLSHTSHLFRFPEDGCCRAYAPFADFPDLPGFLSAPARRGWAWGPLPPKRCE